MHIFEKKSESWEKPSWVKEINISEISWLLPNPETTNSSLIIESLFINKPVKYDSSYKKVTVDTMCNWKITENTPDAAIKNVTLVEFNSLDPYNPKWQDPVNEWSKTDDFYKVYWNIPNLITKINENECERSWVVSDIKIWTTLDDSNNFSIWENFIELAYKSSNPIIKVNFYIWDSLIEEMKIDNKKQSSFTWKIFIPASKKNKKTITIEVIDNQYYSDKITKNINIQ